LKDVQRLIGYVAVVSRFISRLGEKALPLYKLMKKSDKFVWTDEADAALKDLKRVLSTAPVLAAPEDRCQSASSRRQPIGLSSSSSW
jgi:hypothetical protein